MKQLSIYLPSLAADYSGVCSALFDLPCLVIIQDAGCCTRNYVDYDEPRWSRTKRTTLCAQLRTIDAILGNDEKLITLAQEGAEQLRPAFIALVGSPVPALTGTDFEGIAREVENRTGLPVLGFGTTGFANCHRGMDMALGALCARFARLEAAPCPGQVNVLGLTPLDFGAGGNDQRIRDWLAAAGFGVNACMAMGCTLDQIARLGEARVNLVVSRGGMQAARWLERTFGTPWVAGVPVGERGGAALAGLIRATASGGSSHVYHSQGEPRGNHPLLVVGEQILANSLRSALTLAGCPGPITVASLFGLDRALALPGDMALDGEETLFSLLRGGRFRGLIADPLITGLPGARGLWTGEWVHPAVSSSLYWDRVPPLLGEETDALLCAWMEKGG